RRNLEFGIRMMFKNRGLAILAVLSLALGIGFTTAGFSIVNMVVFRSLPVGHPEQLVYLDTSNPPLLSVPVMSYPDYQDYRDRNTTLSGLIAYRLLPMNLSHSAGQSDRLWGFLASGNYFEVLRVPALIGRTVGPSDDVTPGGHPVTVLSYAAWRNRFGGDENIIGRHVKVTGVDFTIVGVMPPSFTGTELWLQPDLWVPMMMQAQMEPGN